MAIHNPFRKDLNEFHQGVLRRCLGCVTVVEMVSFNAVTDDVIVTPNLMTV